MSKIHNDLIVEINTRKRNRLIIGISSILAILIGISMYFYIFLK